MSKVNVKKNIIVEFQTQNADRTLTETNTIAQTSDNSLSVNVWMADTNENVDALIEALNTYKKERVNNG